MKLFMVLLVIVLTVTLVKGQVILESLERDRDVISPLRPLCDDGQGEGAGNMNLYNTCVMFAQRYRCPLKTFVGEVLKLLDYYHQGVLVVLRNTDRWLVHKGDEYGNATDTVVEAASTMDRSWEAIGPVKDIFFSNLDYVAASGEEYDLYYDNCIDAANRMMELN